MYNTHNYQFQDHHMFPGLKRGHNLRTWIQCRSYQKQRTGARHEHTRRTLATQRKLHALRPNHDQVHSITSIKHFYRKLTAVNRLHSLVLSVPQHQTIVKSKLAPALGRLLQFQGFQESIHLQHNMYKSHTKTNFKYFQIQWLHPSLGLEPRSTNHISTVPTARPRLQYKIS